MSSSRRCPFNNLSIHCTRCTKWFVRFGNRAPCARVDIRRNVTSVTTAAAGRSGGRRDTERSVSDGHHRSSGTRSTRAVGSDGQGPEKERDWVPVEHRHRGGLHGTRLLDGRDAWVHRRRQRSRRARPRGDARGVHPDAASRGRLQILQPRRPRRRHHVRVGHAHVRAIHRLAERLGDLPLRRDRDGLAGGHRGDLHVQALRLQRTRRNPKRRSSSARCCGSRS